MKNLVKKSQLIILIIYDRNWRLKKNKKSNFFF